ncbi:MULTISPECIES: patatin-like phospholipase family protein [unclassified Janthinobacterium]|uniref:patatin-like phospholipase family protein n=1 Tax=unclassified Janthinobacterium TaxID=2610881 RepID=UPI00034C9B65|nr:MULTISPECIES: patatin-like phospholipase family protein [unclassified Janthinobacterium]MEC5161749.1 putative acylesterase/phospholipase RssA [Janthinobacterium sp. CG_S6]
MNQSPKYQRCLVMAGGGFRFPYYLGMYAAAVDSGNPPDLLLASCGGSIAAAVIQALPDDAQRKAWVSSPAMYAFLCGLQSTPKAAIGRSFVRALKRRLQKGRTKLVPDLFDDYFFEIPPELPLPPRQSYDAPAVAIVGGKILFEPEDVGQLRAGRKLFAETVFGDARSAALLDGMVSPLSAPQWGDNAIAPRLLTDVGMPIGDAVRISISDMFYFRCHAHEDQHYMGGVIDLFPIEVAQRMAHSVVIEMKAPFSQNAAIPALRAVLGIDGNQRLRHIHAQRADVWIDSSDVEQVLRSSGMQQKLAWRENRIRLVMPADYRSFVVQVETQWQYGYQRAREAFAKAAAGEKPQMRHATKHNRPAP